MLRLRGLSKPSRRSATIASIAALFVLVGAVSANAAAGSSVSLVYSGNGAEAERLSGATLSGISTISIGGASSSLASVQYFLDDAGGTKEPASAPTAAPYSMKIDTSKLQPGRHSVLAVITTASGKSQDLFARFTVGAGSGGSGNATPSIAVTTTKAPTAVVAPGSSTTQSQGKCAAPAGLKLQDFDTEDGDYPWPSNGGEVKVLVDASKLDVKYMKYAKQGAASWSKSPCIDMSVVDACPAGSNCVTIEAVPAGAEGDDGDFTGEESGGKLTGGAVRFFTNYTDTNNDRQIQALVTHELGHAIGLAHRLENLNDLMASETEDVPAEPDKVDYDNLLVLYGSGN